MDWCFSVSSASSSSDSDSSQSCTKEDGKINNNNNNKLQDILFFIHNSSLQHAKAAHYVSSYSHNAASTTPISGPVTVLLIRSATSRIFPDDIRFQFIPVLLQACKMFRDANLTQDFVYEACRTGLLDLLSGCTGYRSYLGVNSYDLVPFLAELATEIRTRFSWTASLICRLGKVYLEEFIKVFVFIRNEIMDKFIASSGPMEVPRLNKGEVGGEEICRLSVCHSEEEVMICIHRIFVYLMSGVEEWLMKMESAGYLDHTIIYFEFFCNLNSISKFYCGCDEMFWEMLRRRRHDFSFLNFLLFQYAHGYHEELKWILEGTENFEERREVAMMFLPKTTCTSDEKVFIDRSDLLASSFCNIMNAKPEILWTYFDLQFKNEEAVGAGVFSEWLLLVCQEIFDPVNNLFVACGSHHRRFFPNAAAKVNLEYFNFAGRVIALALIHNVQVDVALDRVLYLQLANEDTSLSLEDIRDTDPHLYTSCKQILEMDAEIVNQDVLGLTFVREIDGKVIELCPGGTNKVVNSENRKAYVDSLIRHIFFESIRDQVAQFAQGFDDVFIHGCGERDAFFRCLYVEDVDMMLLGSGSEIPVDDWRSHTVYEGFQETDPQISWFWEIVRNMSKEQKIALLYFWTSVRYLPFNGFDGFRHKLWIVKTFESCDCLPSSHTCFYQLLFPAYGSYNDMCDRLNFITQEYVATSFGIE